MRRQCVVPTGSGCRHRRCCAGQLPTAHHSRRYSVPSEQCMKIIVTVKQVPDPYIPPTHFKVDEGARKVVPPAGVAPVMNGYDGNALEAALRLKEKHGGSV